MASAHQGAGNKCETVNMAAPWEPVFYQQFDAMLENLEKHLKNTPSPNPSYSLYDFVTIIRLAGINRTTDEFRIPAEILQTPCAFNAIDTWVNAALVTSESNATNYLPSRMVLAWDKLTQSYHDHFGDKYFNVVVIGTNSGSKANKNKGNGQFPFPCVDNNGCVYSMYLPTTFTPTWTQVPCFNSGPIGSGGGLGDDSPDQNHDMISLATQKFPGKLTAEVENLHDRGKFPDYRPAPPAHNVVSYAEDFGTTPAYMTNNYFGAPVASTAGGMSCGPLSNPTRCFPSQYLATLKSGIAPDTSAKSSSDPYLHSPRDIFPRREPARVHALFTAGDESRGAGTRLWLSERNQGCGRLPVFRADGYHFISSLQFQHVLEHSDAAGGQSNRKFVDRKFNY